ncbi:diacylglycerol kinase family protein [Labilibacter marinus]|uniref:diacylglycerol kinase family protein n=1 Tax=Labilibacter marinus TaxID=1477105 RepID=UPI00095010A1|nr:diacylglycerol kinase family protein [Labilibacter marinus]
MSQSKFSFLKRLHSFKYAFNGLKILLKEEHNSRIHLFATIVVLALGLFFKISKGEWIAVILAIGIVISMELINSAIESLADFVSADRHPLIKKSKDLAAGAVLWAAICAFVVGSIIFLPKIWNLIF